MNEEYNKQILTNVLFEECLLKLTEKIRTFDYSNELYSALCNMRWQNIKDPKKIYSCSWRYAGGMIAEIRNMGEDYLNFYCNGNEGFVSERIEKDLNKLGWKSLEWDFDII